MLKDGSPGLGEEVKPLSSADRTHFPKVSAPLVDSVKGPTRLFTNPRPAASGQSTRSE